MNKALERVPLSRQHASVAHLVERHLAKVEVASSSLVTRSNFLEHSAAPLWCHSQVVRQSSAKAPLPSSNLGGTSRISKRYRCRRLNAYGIKRFRAFFARKFTDDSIDAKGLILGIAQI